ncbi:hypothetical protein [Streptomyces rochei]|uniref:hypothetical protein n=1 Tax=Streptomyces rochei TaxID=1928 RepID=UPI0036BBAB77
MVVTATDGSFAAGMVTGGIHHHRHTGPRIPATWPHQVGVIPSRAQYFQQRADADRVAGRGRGDKASGDSCEQLVLERAIEDR